MPYIIQSKRHELDPAINQVVDVLRQFESDGDVTTNNTEGNINYIICTLLTNVYGTSYRDVNDAIGVLECAKLEFYRRVAGPYEDQKAFDNGDVFGPK